MVDDWWKSIVIINLKLYYWYDSKFGSSFDIFPNIDDMMNWLQFKKYEII
jgi:hypothetical protein